MKYEIEKWFSFVNYQCSEIELAKTLNFFSDERKEVFNQFENLSWYTDVDKQLYAIDYLSEELLPEEYIYLLLADRYTLEPYKKNEKYYTGNTGKERWENAAKTIIKIGWPRVDNIIVPLFVWLIDPNWPGSELIYSFLLSLPSDVLKKKMDEIINSRELYDASVYNDLRLQIENLKSEITAV